MARHLRVEYPGAIYHVTCRMVGDWRKEKSLLFRDDADRERFIEQLSKATGAGTNARAWRRLLPFGEIVRAVESVKRESWKEFANRRGDWGRDLALEIGRRHGGMTLRELGAETEMNLHAVSKAVSRIQQRLQTDKALRRDADRVQKLLEREEGTA